MITTITSWTETLSENTSDAEEQMNQDCLCGVALHDHYDPRGRWVSCVEKASPAAEPQEQERHLD